MGSSYTKQEYAIYLKSLPITSLRVLGRSFGVEKASSSNKDALVNSIVAILTGEAEPVPHSKRGAPPKESYIAPEILERLKQIGDDSEYDPEKDFIHVATDDGIKSIFDQQIYTGILEITSNGYGFLRTNNCQPSGNGEDVFLSAPVIHRYKLREGDFLSCTASPRQKNDSPALDKLLAVNGVIAETMGERPYFDHLTAKYANEKIVLAYQEGPLSLRILDLFAPVGKGQCALIVAPPKAGKTTLLKEIARSIESNHSEIELIVLLIDERPEEVTDIRMDLQRAEVVYSTFDEGAEHHARAAQLTIAHAKRLAEQGKDVVILLDSLTKLTRAYNHIAQSTGKTLSGGLNASAFSEPKRFFGAARNTVEAGSLTILASVLIDTGSRMDDVIFEEFKGTGNADIILSQELAERRIFPAIDLHRSGTRKEELLLDEKELNAVTKIREKGLTANISGLFDMMKRTSDNAEFISRLPDWLKIFQNK